MLGKAGVTHGCTDASFGVLRYGRGVVDGAVDANRQAWRQATGVSSHVVFLTEQVHGNDVLEAGNGQGFVQLGKGDALITDKQGGVLVMKTADCVPVLIYDPVHRAVAAVHSGWKGTAKNVVAATVQAMSVRYGTQAQDLVVAFGPSVCAKHYDVTRAEDDRVALFTAQFGDDPSIIVRSGQNVALDVAAACKRQCLKLGVQAGNIETAGICTFEVDSWPSFRREGNGLRHDIWSFIGVPTKEQ